MADSHGHPTATARETRCRRDWGRLLIGLWLGMTLMTGLSLRAAEPLVLETLLHQVRPQPGQVLRFREFRRLAELDDTLESRGRLAYEPPDTLIKHTESPVEEVLSLQGEQVSIAVAGRTQVAEATSLPGMGALATALRGLFLGEAEALRAMFDIELSGQAHHWQLDLMPRTADARALFQRLRIQGDEQSVGSVEMLFRNGDESLMRLHDAP